MKYIDLEKAKKEIRGIENIARFIRVVICEILDELPITEINDGVWIGTADGYSDGELIYDNWNCSVCDHCIEEDNPRDLPNFCPECGARMIKKSRRSL